MLSAGWIGRMTTTRAGYYYLLSLCKAKHTRERTGGNQVRFMFSAGHSDSSTVECEEWMHLCALAKKLTAKFGFCLGCVKLRAWPVHDIRKMVNGTADTPKSEGME